MSTSPLRSRPAAFIPLRCPLDAIAIRVEPGGPPPPNPDMLERWRSAALANPRLFNGPILRYMAHATSGGETVVTARHDTYQRYAMQRHVAAAADPARDVYHLAVTGIVTARDAHGQEAVLLGKRGASTYVYPHMWEHAPGGGLETADIYDQLLREMEEELGLTGLVDGSRRDEILMPPGSDDVLGLAIDPNTPSVDIVVRLRVRDRGQPARAGVSWEYGSTRWVPVSELSSFLNAQRPETVIPPAIAIWRGMGWI